MPLDEVSRDLEAELPPPGIARIPSASRSWTPEEEGILEQCELEARELKTHYYGTEHLLLALLRNRSDTASRLLARYGVERSDALAHVRLLLGFASAQ